LIALLAQESLTCSYNTTNTTQHDIQFSAVAHFALPALDKLQHAQQQRQQEAGADATPKSLRDDLRWLSALW
jgi:hypothetical protein